MSWTIAAALAALALGGVLKLYLASGWYRYYTAPQLLIFPKVCPVCLGPAEVVVEERSAGQATANYVVMRKIEWWTAIIPHCSNCKRKQGRDVTIGIFLGIGFAVTVFLLTSAPDQPRGIIFYACFVYPFYVIADYFHKGIAFGWTTTKAISMRIRRTDYYERFIALNEPSAAVGDVPLAGNKGVWRH